MTLLKLCLKDDVADDLIHIEKAVILPVLVCAGYVLQYCRGKEGVPGHVDPSQYVPGGRKFRYLVCVIRITWRPHPKKQSSSSHLVAQLQFPPTYRLLVNAMCEEVGLYSVQLEIQIGRPFPGCQEASRDQQIWQGLTANNS